MSQSSVITIKDGDYLYIIPSPNILVDSITIPNGVNIRTIDMTNNDINNQESRIFFIEHPDIFKKYLDKIQNNIPGNFDVYIQNILIDIKTNNLDVYGYWANMKAGKKRRTMRKRKITRKKRTTRRKRTMRRRRI